MQEDKLNSTLMLQLSDQLQKKGFSTRVADDGLLLVSSESVVGARNSLCSVGKNGEVYCNSKDFAIPRRAEHLHSVLETVNRFCSEIEQTQAPEQAFEGGMTLG